MRRKRSRNSNSVVEELRKLKQKMCKQPKRQKRLSSDSSLSVSSVASSDHFDSLRAVSPLPHSSRGQWFPSDSEVLSPAGETSHKGDPTGMDPGPSAQPPLAQDLLALLGPPVPSGPSEGPELQSDLAGRWRVILTMGMELEERNNLISEYSVPGNCEFLNPPRLNAIV
ncbi:hypothetical protein ABEB36_004651 [Hypothenemus hampei]|uniref:Uncharacterized protein n=1 Tax=Hypothenemus hampei TaxID=57062 RepID=A0ABD1F411_HYPHA